jgi:hypothetical protein
MLHLQGHSLAFSEWLAHERRPAPTIMRCGVSVPATEQDGYYQKDYEEWQRLGSPQQESDPCQKQVLNLRQKDDIWRAELIIEAAAIGRSREAAEENVRLRAERLVRSTSAPPISTQVPS